MQKEDLVSRLVIPVMQDFNQSQHSKQGSDWVWYVGRAVLATRVEAMGLGARGNTGGNLGKVTSRHPTALMGKLEGTQMIMKYKRGAECVYCSRVVVLPDLTSI